MGWSMTSVPAVVVALDSGDVYRCSHATGFIMADGESYPVGCMMPGDKFADGKSVVSVKEDGSMDYFINKED